MDYLPKKNRRIAYLPKFFKSVSREWNVRQSRKRAFKEIELKAFQFYMRHLEDTDPDKHYKIRCDIGLKDRDKIELGNLKRSKKAFKDIELRVFYFHMRPLEDTDPEHIELRNHKRRKKAFEDIKRKAFHFYMRHLEDTDLEEYFKVRRDFGWEDPEYIEFTDQVRKDTLEKDISLNLFPIIRAELREDAKQVLLQRFDKRWPAFEHLGVERPVVRFRRMKRRWGSCSQKGGILLNTKLLRAPSHCIDYVIVHQLCHLIHPNHDRAFFRLLTKVMPDWKLRMERLNQLSMERRDPLSNNWVENQ